MFYQSFFFSFEEVFVDKFLLMNDERLVMVPDLACPLVVGGSPSFLFFGVLCNQVKSMPFAGE